MTLHPEYLLHWLFGLWRHPFFKNIATLGISNKYVGKHVGSCLLFFTRCHHNSDPVLCLFCNLLKDLGRVILHDDWLKRSFINPSSLAMTFSFFSFFLSIIQDLTQKNSIRITFRVLSQDDSVTMKRPGF